MKNRILAAFFLLVAIGLLAVASSNAAFGEETSANETATPVIGDANCDGQVNVRDAFTVLRGDAGLRSAGVDPHQAADCLSLGDVNCDVSLDVRDALAILRFDVGLPLPASGDCRIGGSVPGDDPEMEIVRTEKIIDSAGREYQLVTAVRKSSGATVQASSGIRTHWAERSVKNAFGQKLATLRHIQDYYFYSGRVWLFSPRVTHSSMLGWDVNNIRQQGPYQYTTWGYAYHTAEFKLKDPFFGWTLQSVGVYAGVTAYGDGRAYGWWG